MKNVHIVPTDKPSRLRLDDGELVLGNSKLCQSTLNYQYQNIYITSDLEIRKGDWVFANQGAHKVTDIKDDKYPYGTFNYKGDKIYHHKSWKKIILTTDQDLIKDGVQAIDDEFLEWFVKNPSCEEVEVKELLSNNGNAFYGYKIITPQEETKCTCKEHDPYCCQVHGICPTCVKKEESKQETLTYTEAAKKEERIFNSTMMSKQETFEEAMIKNGYHDKESDNLWREGAEFGAKWQQERSYSEEEVILLLQKYRVALSAGETPNLGDTTKQWFEQFKNK
jgi:hypothetical protein